MTIPAVEQELCKARDMFKKTMQWISDAAEDGLRADQAEREIFAQLI